MDGIWESLLDQGYEPELTAAQKAEIDRRLAEDDAAPDDVVSWEEVKAAALRSVGCVESAMTHLPRSRPSEGL